MTQEDEERALEKALDGLLAAVDYAESIGKDELSYEIAQLYQRLAKASPDDHWDDVHTYKVTVQTGNPEQVLADTDALVTGELDSHNVVVNMTKKTRERVEQLDTVATVDRIDTTQP